MEYETNMLQQIQAQSVQIEKGLGEKEKQAVSSSAADMGRIEKFEIMIPPAEKEVAVSNEKQNEKEKSAKKENNPEKKELPPQAKQHVISQKENREYKKEEKNNDIPSAQQEFIKMALWDVMWNAPILFLRLIFDVMRGTLLQKKLEVLDPNTNDKKIRRKMKKVARRLERKVIKLANKIGSNHPIFTILLEAQKDEQVMKYLVRKVLQYALLFLLLLPFILMVKWTKEVLIAGLEEGFDFESKNPEEKELRKQRKKEDKWKNLINPFKEKDQLLNSDGDHLVSNDNLLDNVHPTGDFAENSVIFG